MNKAVAGDKNTVPHLDMPAQQRAVGEYNIVSHPRIMSHMTVRHQEVVRSYNRLFRLAVRPMHGYMLPENVIVAYPQPRRLATVLHILRRVTDNTTRMYNVAFSQDRIARNVCVCADPAAVAYLNPGINHGIRIDAYVVA